MVKIKGCNSVEHQITWIGLFRTCKSKICRLENYVEFIFGQEESKFGQEQKRGSRSEKKRAWGEQTTLR